MLLRVQRPSGRCTSLIIVETGDALSARTADEVSGGGKGHDQHKCFHGQRQTVLPPVRLCGTGSCFRRQVFAPFYSTTTRASVVGPRGRPWRSNYVGPFRLWLWVKRYFAIFLNECSPHTGGDRGRRSAGRAPRDGGNAPHSRSFYFRWERRRRTDVVATTAGLPQVPQPPVGPCQSPAKAGLCFLGVVTPLLCADRHIRNTRCTLPKV